MNSEFILFTKMYDFLVWLYPTVKKFPKSERYVLGERLELAALQCMDGVIEYCHGNQSALKQTDLSLERVRIYIRLCKDLHLLDMGKYEFASKKVVELGKLVGGVIKSQSQ